MVDVRNDQTGTTGARSDGVVVRERVRHVSWGAILLGFVVAIAIQILLGLLGTGLGFSLLDPADPMGGIGNWGIGTAIYVVIVQIVSLLAGGYIASRLAPALTDQSAMFHGLSIWALATIVMVWVGTTTMGAIVSGASGAVSGIASVTTQAVQTVVPDDISLPDISFEDLPEPLRQTLEENGITAENFRQELQAVYREAVSREEEQRLLQKLQETVRSVLQNPTQAQQEIDQALDETFGPNGILSEENLEDMRNALQRRLNLSDQEVQQIQNEVEQAVQQARETTRQAIATAREEAAQAAEAVSDQIGKIALWLFFANLLALVAAVIGGKMGEVNTRRY